LGRGAAFPSPTLGTVAPVRLSDSYDVPESVASGHHSPTFSKFLRNWFGDTTALTQGELDITFLSELTPEELSLARELIRRNLRLKHNHVIEGAAALHDLAAAPILHAMLDDESDMSRRLTIAGALWKINRDPVFIKCLQEAKSVRASIFAYVHLWQVLWLDDERAVDFLIDLLDEKDWTVQSLTLGLLNQLESGRRMGIPAREMPHQPADYRKLRGDPAFRAQMTAAIRQWNAQSKNGR
jgi:hypothetical protein